MFRIPSKHQHTLQVQVNGGPMPQVEVEYSIVNDYSSSIANISNSGLIQALNLGYFAFITARVIENLLELALTLS